MTKPATRRAPSTEAADLAKALATLELVNQPGHLLRRAQQRAVEIYAQEVGDTGLRPPQFAVVLTVFQNPGLNQTALVQLTGIDRSTIADMLSRLVRRGILKRRRTDSDGRANTLQLTEQGEAMLREAVRIVNRVQERILEPLAPAEREVFMRLLMKVSDLPNSLSFRRKSD
ncbi:MAG: MarR family winged helix-turn-helix transcriptional regulator [Alphaproteobacteria bacterium]